MGGDESDDLAVESISSNTSKYKKGGTTDISAPIFARLLFFRLS